MEGEISNSFQTNSKKALHKTIFLQSHVNFYPIHKENLHLIISISTTGNLRGLGKKFMQ